LSGKNVDVHIAGNSGGTVSLAYVHYLRAALQTAVGAGKSVTINSILTPSFKGMDWWANDGSYETRDLYSGYSTAVSTEIMAGINVVRTGSSPSYTYYIEYDRDIKVDGLVALNHTVNKAQGLGLKRKSGSIAKPIGNWATVYVNGGNVDALNGDYGTAADFASYSTFLTEAGLHPSQQDKSNAPILLNHSNVNISAGGLANVMANGMYDFILAYYNPTSTGAAAPGTTDLKARLPSWPSNLTFNGSSWPAGLTSRNIGGVTANNLDRKDATGSPNNNFIGNITVAMANYMRSIGIQARFMNTNIIGDSGQWTAGDGVSMIVGDTIILIPLNNVGLIGNYDIGSLSGIFKGVIDIKGATPKYISQNDSTTRGYINLWNVSQNMGVNRFYVVSIRDLNGIGYVNKEERWLLNQGPASVVIYPKKYNPTAISGEVSYLRPSYRAFMSDNNGGGTAGIMPVNATVTNIASYRGTVTSTGGAPSLYSLLESEWITAGNNNDDAPSPVTYANAVSNFSVNTTQFESWSAAAAPAQTGIRLASMPRPAIEAVLTDKRRFGRA
jgi:hypothetical protein